ncbi:DHHC palmitoyltransferase-domain-containing protein [Piptocephalis cylindrospora]|uniref:Palmitoyltransferase n=1 Tax=Piptocephalis cylindrospora TaxID=1907219 RepID=A0A4P9Y2U6_9FUNG|nr:DHHC palmitoyltransferase-domain-containing protein [Piptocephalis cylindrospora]|eukprot:RKP13113.1 DHHC palmitoyltransferase-domain-containing protein [Piptocephalis cylindrospora]
MPWILLSDHPYLPRRLEWRRHSGYSLPLDILILLQYLMYGLFLTVYFTSTRRILPIYPGMALPFDILLPMLTFIVFVLSICVSLKDVEEEACKGRSHGRTVPLDLRVSTDPHPIIDRNTRYCRICSTTVSSGTRHCRRCNKCVRGYNHHCRWLNTCIGDANLRGFYALVGLNSLLALLNLVPTVLVFAAYFSSIPGYYQYSHELFPDLDAPGIPVMIITSFALLGQAICAIGLLQLGYIHLRFWYRGRKSNQAIVRHLPSGDTLAVSDDGYISSPIKDGREMHLPSL